MTPQKIAIAVVRRGNAVLIAPRPADGILEGVWEFPGGKVEPGETCAAAAVRECREETGLNVIAHRVLERTTWDYGHGPLSLTFIECRCCEDDSVVLPPFRFVPITSLGDYPFPPANTAVLEALTRQPPAST